ncbi:MAG: hypothetical protein KDE09_19180 [Anaerolineales bacterium]|nr:hypothetical protein [Anaerolineales bacterium]MCB0019925.1 hypothetical protein [Anaerolineales bacterium]
MATVNWRQQRALLALRGRLTLRQFMREPGQIFGVIVVIAIFVPLFLGLAAGVALAYYFWTEPWTSLVLGGAFFIAWLIWITFPIFFNSLAENFDLSRLIVFPISRRDLLASTIIGSILDYPMYFLLPLSAAVLVSWGLGPQLILVIPALIVGYGVMLLSGQLVTLLLGAILQSRRFRDALMLMFSLLGLSCMFTNLVVNYLSEQVQFTGTNASANIGAIFSFLQWLPPGAVAQSIRLSATGNWLAATGWLLYAAAWVAVMGWLWYRLVHRLFVGSGYVLQLGAGAEKQSRQEERRSRFSWIPADIRAVAFKEMKSVWRTPSRRLLLVQGLFFPLAMLMPFFLGGQESFELPAWFGLALLPMALLTEWAATMNMLGFEGRGLPALLLLPFSPRRYFMGKTLGLALVSLPSLYLVGIVLFWFNGHWSVLIGLLLVPAVALLASGLNAVISAYFPTPVNLEKMAGRNNGARGGLIAGLFNGMVSPALNGLVFAPVMLAMIAAYRLGWWLGVLIVPAAYLYAYLVFRVTVSWAGKRLLAAGPEIMAQAALPEDR